MRNKTIPLTDEMVEYELERLWRENNDSVAYILLVAERGEYDEYKAMQAQREYLDMVRNLEEFEMDLEDRLE